MSLISILKDGGWIMWPLVAISIVAWGVCVERFWSLKGWYQKNKSFLLSFQNLWLKGDVESARKICEKETAVDLAEIALELFTSDSSKEISDKLRQKIDRRRLEQAVELRKNLWILGTIGSATPFLGLFGTVVGIIKAFESMAQTGAGGFTVVAAGISEALVATAGGIIVAVIAVFFFNYFQVKVGKMQFQLKIFTEELLEIFDTKVEETKRA